MKYGILLVLALSQIACGLQFDTAVPEEVKNQIVQDLGYMAAIEGKGVSPLHKEIFGEVKGEAYEQFIQTRVKRVGMNGCGNANAVACVIPLLSTTKIFLTQNYVKFSHPFIAKMMVVYHEARHTERANGFWSHADCPVPFVDSHGKDVTSIWTGAALQGEPACDETPYGSYGSSLILLKNIAQFCTSCTEKVKMDAGMYADDQLIRIIDEEAKTAIHNDLYKRVL